MELIAAGGTGGREGGRERGREEGREGGRGSEVQTLYKQTWTFLDLHIARDGHEMV